jgi:uncharacterized protein YecE (DUF72 family)
VVGGLEGVIRIGCSGWSYEHWRGLFYPRSGSSARWLELYAQSFDTVEVNATFYRLPTLKTVEGWAARTPDDFVFTVKASRYLTHVRRLRDLGDGIARMDACVEPLRQAGKLAAVLWQLPPQFARDDGVLVSALESLSPGRHAFEFRDPSWFAAEVYEILREHQVALVVADRAPGQPSPRVETASWSYVRFHAGRGSDGNYSAQQLQEWAIRIKSRPEDVLAYFNNDWQGFAIANARTLRGLVSDARSPSTTTSSSNTTGAPRA